MPATSALFTFHSTMASDLAQDTVVPNVNGIDASKQPSGSDHEASNSEITKTSAVNG